MFRWYKSARRCYVYFNDVEWDVDGPEESHAKFRASKWFTRGWTLQELLAPQFLECYDRHWVQFGDRDSLAEDLTSVTGISDVHLKDQRTASVAAKLSWASSRQTSRVEDMAYSLLGLFNVNMPLLYGEGSNAFLRLQRKIIRKTADETIFAWSDPPTFKPHGMLAPSPAAFANCGGLITVSDDRAAPRRPYSMTNKGLELFVNLPKLTEEIDDSNPHHTLVLGLNCERRQVAVGEGRYLAIVLKRFEDGWRRINCDEDCTYKGRVETVFKSGSRVWPAVRSEKDMTAIYVAQD